MKFIECLSKTVGKCQIKLTIMQSKYIFGLVVVAYDFDPNTWEKEAGSSLWVWGQPQTESIPA